MERSATVTFGDTLGSKLDVRVPLAFFSNADIDF